jgi:hypothetical protein
MTMPNLNRAQLAACWVTVALVSFLLVYPTIQATPYQQYKSPDGWVWNQYERPRKEEQIDQQGRPYLVSKTDSDGKTGRIYYYAGPTTQYTLNLTYHPYERITLVVILNGALLVFTLGRRPKSTAPPTE